MHYFVFFFFNDTATTEIYTLSLHDALPISTTAVGLFLIRDSTNGGSAMLLVGELNVIAITTIGGVTVFVTGAPDRRDRKSTRLNSSHLVISYAVFCLKKKKQN